MGFEVKVTYEDKEVQQLFKGLLKRSKNLRPLMKTIGEILTTSVTRNFEVGGRPQKWKPLSASTIAHKGHAKPLIKDAILLGSIHAKAQDRSVTVGPDNRPYAAIQHFGGKAGRNRTVMIPARPYLLVQDEDWEEIKQAGTDYLMQR